MTFLVTREGQDPEVGILLCQLHQLAVVDIRLPSSGGHVHNHTDLARVLAQVHLEADHVTCNTVSTLSTSEAPDISVICTPYLVPVNVSGRELIDVLLALG